MLTFLSQFEVDEEEVITLDENAVTSTRIDTSYLVDASHHIFIENALMRC